MLDKVILDIISTVIVSTSLFSAFGRYKHKNLHRMAWGFNPHQEKAAVIDPYAGRFLVGYAVCGVLVQLFGIIACDDNFLKNRIYKIDIYVYVLLCSLLCSFLIIELLVFMAWKIAKPKWTQVLADLYYNELAFPCFIFGIKNVHYERYAKNHPMYQATEDRHRASNLESAANLIESMLLSFEIKVPSTFSVE